MTLWRDGVPEAFKKGKRICVVMDASEVAWLDVDFVAKYTVLPLEDIEDFV